MLFISWFIDYNRIIVLGGDHKKQPLTYINAESLQRTEIYIQLLSHINSKTIIPSIYLYKYFYALQLIEIGLIDKALKYLQNIKYAIKTNLQIKKALPTYFINHLLNDLYHDVITYQQLHQSSSTSSKIVGSFVSAVGSLFSKKDDQKGKQQQQLNKEQVANASNNKPTTTTTTSTTSTNSNRSRRSSLKQDQVIHSDSGLKTKVSGILSNLFKASPNRKQANLEQDTEYIYDKDSNRYIDLNEHHRDQTTEKWVPNNPANFSQNMPPLPVNRANQQQQITSFMPPRPNNRGNQQQQMPPRPNNRGNQQQQMPPRPNNRGNQQQQMPPRPNNQLNPQHPPRPNNRGNPQQHMPPRPNNQLNPQQHMPPRPNNNLQGLPPLPNNPNRLHHTQRNHAAYNAYHPNR